MGKTVSPVWVSGHFRFENDDGSLTASTFKAAQDTTTSVPVDEKFRLRINWGESAGQTTLTSFTPSLQFRINSGSWITVGGSTAVQYASSSYVTDGTTVGVGMERLTTAPTGCAGYLPQGQFDSNGSMNGRTPVDSYYEDVWNLLMDSAQISDTDVIDFQLVDGAASEAFDVTDTAPSLTATGVTTYTKTTSLGAMVQKQNLLKTAGVDARLQKEFTKTVSADAVVSALQTVVSDIDALVQIQDFLKTADIDAVVQLQDILETVSIDAAVQKSDILKTVGLDAQVIQILSVFTSLDARLQKEFLKTVGIDAALQVEITKNADLDALLQKEGVVLSSIDARVALQDILLTASIDALLQKALTISAGLDAFLTLGGVTTYTVTAELNAILQKLVSINTALDARLQQQDLTVSTSLDTVKAKYRERVSSIDARVLRGSITLSSAVDALAYKLYTLNASLDGIISKQDITLSAAFDAFLVQLGMRSVGLDAILKKFDIATVAYFDAILYVEIGAWKEDGVVQGDWEDENATNVGDVYVPVDEQWDFGEPLDNWYSQHNLTEGITPFDGPLLVVDDAETEGGKALEVGANSGIDEPGLAWAYNIPFNPESLYKMTVRMKKLAGLGISYVGLFGFRADGVTPCAANGATAGFMHYCVLVNHTLTDEYVEHVGYVQGYSAGTTSPTPGTLSSPTKLHPEVVFIRPYFVINYAETPPDYGDAGITRIARVKLEVFDEDDAVWKSAISKSDGWVSGNPIN